MGFAMTKTIFVDVKLGIYSLVTISPAIAFPLEKCFVKKKIARHAKIPDVTVLNLIGSIPYVAYGLNTNA
jgi:hypothetical protein